MVKITLFIEKYFGKLLIAILTFIPLTHINASTPEFIAKITSDKSLDDIRPGQFVSARD